MGENWRICWKGGGGENGQIFGRKMKIASAARTKR